ncbi:MAG: T9SS type A sorting domain-containing protein, partial [Bacteroidetes bacterium]|nr:T9SS type A sorting domain-containing protein [Bacteroidota bacterium]
DNGSSDNCGISGYSLDITSFDCSDIGANIVVLTVTDVNSNSRSKSATVTVIDSTAPNVVTQNITVFLNSSGNASVTPGDVDGGSSDNCGISGYSLDITNFDCSDIGANTVVLTVTDVNSNSRSKSATITVVDTVRPAPDVSPLSISGVGSVTVTAPTATDNCAGSVTGTTSDPTSYNTIGTYSILWTYNDGNGNTTTQTQSVTVLAPTGDDMDNDSLPDSIDPYPTDPNNNGEGLILARVWDDINADGKQNGSEKNNNIEGAYVRLKQHAGGVILQTLQTNADGLVLFRNVPFNTELKLDFVRKSHHEFAQPNQGSDENIDSDASLSNGQTGIFTLISSDKPIVDQDCGQYSPGTIVARVWDDLNGNGIQDPSETNANIEGVKVRLRRASDGVNLQAAQYTNADGLVTFTNVQTDIQVYLDFSAKSNHAIAKSNQGSDGAIDSDADPYNGNTAPFQIVGGNQTIDTIDCGQYSPGTIIAQVWKDDNGDGIKSPGENDGVSGVTVRLRRASDNQSMKTGTTDAGGFVTFDNVPADMQVKLEFVLNSGFDFTAQNIGSNEDFDSDADPVNGQTTPFQLSAGSQILENQDAGFVVTSSSQPRMVEENPTVLVYPNPTTNYVNVEFEGDYDQLMLIDSRGRVISQRRLEVGETLVKLNLEELPEGVYMIRLAGQSGSLIQRVVKR